MYALAIDTSPQQWRLNSQGILKVVKLYTVGRWMPQSQNFHDLEIAYWRLPQIPILVHVPAAPELLRPPSDGATRVARTLRSQ